MRRSPAYGTPSAQVETAPPGFPTLAASRLVRADVARPDGLTRYDIRIPFSGFRISPGSDIVSGFRFNLRVWDDDGEGHDGWIELKPAHAKDGAYDRYPLIIKAINCALSHLQSHGGFGKLPSFSLRGIMPLNENRDKKHGGIP